MWRVPGWSYSRNGPVTRMTLRIFFNNTEMKGECFLANRKETNNLHTFPGWICQNSSQIGWPLPASDPSICGLLVPVLCPWCHWHGQHWMNHVKTSHEEPQKDGNLCDVRQNPDVFTTRCDIYWHVKIQVTRTSKRLHGFVLFLSGSASTLQRLIWSDNSWTLTNRTIKNRWVVLSFENTAWCWKTDFDVYLLSSSDH